MHGHHIFFHWDVSRGRGIADSPHPSWPYLDAPLPILPSYPAVTSEVVVRSPPCDQRISRTLHLPSLPLLPHSPVLTSSLGWSLSSLSLRLFPPYPTLPACSHAYKVEVWSCVSTDSGLPSGQGKAPVPPTVCALQKCSWNTAQGFFSALHVFVPVRTVLPTRCLLSRFVQLSNVLPSLKLSYHHFWNNLWKLSFW